MKKKDEWASGEDVCRCTLLERLEASERAPREEPPRAEPKPPPPPKDEPPKEEEAERAEKEAPPMRPLLR